MMYLFDYCFFVVVFFRNLLCSHSKRECAILLLLSQIWKKGHCSVFFSFCPTRSDFFISKAALITALGLVGGAAHTVLVWAKSSILQQINYKTNRSIILNLESRQAKKWEQYEGPASCSSLKGLPSTHDKADCDCGTDGLWTITSDVFMDLQCDPLWNIAAVSTKNWSM